MSKKELSPIYRKDYSLPDHLIQEVFLDFDLKENATTVHSKILLFRNPDVLQVVKNLKLHGEQMKLISLKLDGKELDKKRYALNDEQLIIYDVPEKFEIEIENEIKPHENTALTGLYRTNGLYCTQCESQGFRRITYFLDRPDVMSKYTVSIEADKTKFPKLLSNGNLVKHEELNNNRHRVTWVDPFKKPSYLFALVAGDLECREDHFMTCSNRNVTLQIYVEKGNYEKTAHAMQCLKDAMRWDEQAYGREYDLDIYMIVAVSDFNMGAMENKGLNVFNDKYILVDSQTATDQDYENVITVVGHEYFHNWTGNRITLRDWFQITLKEGLTVFREQQFRAAMTSTAEARINEVNHLRTTQFSEDRGPMAHPVRPDSYIEINNFYTATVYSKGAEVIRMIFNLLGEQKFKKGMDLYFERHDGQAVTCEDFVKTFEDANQIDLTQFKRWYSQAGTPEINIEDQYNSAEKTYTLTISQMCPPTAGQPKKEPFHLPISMSAYDSAGHCMPLQLDTEAVELATRQKTLAITEPTQEFHFINIKEKPIPSILQNFSAPVKVDKNDTFDDLVFLLIHDKDGFNRWEAAQRLAQRVIFKLIDDYKNDKSLQVSTAYIDAYKRILEQSDTEKLLLSQLLVLPNERYLGQMMDIIDVDAIHYVRRHVIRELALQLKDQFYALYEKHQLTGDYQFTMEDAGSRRVKNIALEYIRLLEDDASRTLCVEQFQKSNNMTDKIAALRVLSNIDHADRIKALDEFYLQWEHESLVIDKWFAIQAISELPNTLKAVEKLLQHPAFNIKNPNKVYALLVSFCSLNPVHFHQPDGQGYRLLTHYVSKLNALNPQVAARVLTPITRWHRFDEKRQVLMRQALEQLIKLPNLSKDIYEMVKKSLEFKV